MITKYICERCEFTTENPDEFRYIAVDNKFEDIEKGDALRISYRLCNTCVDEIHDFIKHPKSYY